MDLPRWNPKQKVLATDGTATDQGEQPGALAEVAASLNCHRSSQARWRSPGCCAEVTRQYCGCDVSATSMLDMYPAIPARQARTSCAMASRRSTEFCCRNRKTYLRDKILHGRNFCAICPGRPRRAPSAGLERPACRILPHRQLNSPYMRHRPSGQLFGGGEVRRDLLSWRAVVAVRARGRVGGTSWELSAGRQTLPAAAQVAARFSQRRVFPAHALAGRHWCRRLLKQEFILAHSQASNITSGPNAVLAYGGRGEQGLDHLALLGEAPCIHACPLNHSLHVGPRHLLLSWRRSAGQFPWDLSLKYGHNAGALTAENWSGESKHKGREDGRGRRRLRNWTSSARP